MKKIRKILTKHKLTSTLAKKLNNHPSTINIIVKEGHNPHWSTKMRYTEALNKILEEMGEETFTFKELWSYEDDDINS